MCGYPLQSAIETIENKLELEESRICLATWDVQTTSLSLSLSHSAYINQLYAVVVQTLLDSRACVTSA